MPHIGVQPIPQATWRRPYGKTQNITDTIAVPYGYTVGYLRVEIEGRALNPDEYTADDGMVVTFPQSLPAGTNWAFEIITPFQAADHWTKGEADARFQPELPSTVYALIENHKVDGVTVSTNIGGAADAAGLFTAPVTGMYCVAGKISPNGGDGTRSLVNLIYNGSGSGGSHPLSGEYSDYRNQATYGEDFALSALLWMNAGDTVNFSFHSSDSAGGSIKYGIGLIR